MRVVIKFYTTVLIMVFLVGVTDYSMYSCLVDVSGNVYVSQLYNIFKLTAPYLNVASNFIGQQTSGNTDGYGTHAAFYGIFAMTFNSNQTDLYVSDYYNNVVRRVNVSTNSTTWRVSLSYPYGIVIDSTNNNLYVASYYGIIKVVIATKAVSQYAGGYMQGNDLQSAVNVLFVDFVAND